MVTEETTMSIDNIITQCLSEGWQWEWMTDGVYYLRPPEGDYRRDRPTEWIGYDIRKKVPGWLVK